jgi:hypothetical protein
VPSPDRRFVLIELVRRNEVRLRALEERVRSAPQIRYFAPTFRALIRKYQIALTFSGAHRGNGTRLGLAQRAPDPYPCDCPAIDPSAFRVAGVSAGRPDGSRPYARVRARRQAIRPPRMASAGQLRIKELTPARPLRYGHPQAREGERVDPGPLGRCAEAGFARGSREPARRSNAFRGHHR